MSHTRSTKTRRSNPTPYSRPKDPSFAPSLTYASTSALPSEDEDERSIPGFPTYSEYKLVESAYLDSLSERKRAKALISQKTFDLVWDVLHDANAKHGTPQDRFWVRKRFKLQPGTPPVVIHDGMPVAIIEQMYELLCFCHAGAKHAGRDRTCDIVRKHYSYVPKQLTSRFVKACPTCSSMRRTTVTPPTPILEKPVATASRSSIESPCEPGFSLDPAPVQLREPIQLMSLAELQLQRPHPPSWISSTYDAYSTATPKSLSPLLVQFDEPDSDSSLPPSLQSLRLFPAEQSERDCAGSSTSSYSCSLSSSTSSSSSISFSKHDFHEYFSTSPQVPSKGWSPQIDPALMMMDIDEDDDEEMVWVDMEKVKTRNESYSRTQLETTQPAVVLGEREKGNSALYRSTIFVRGGA